MSEKEKIGVLVKFAFLITLKLITVLKFVLMSIIKGLLLFMGLHGKTCLLQNTVNIS